MLIFGAAVAHPDDVAFQYSEGRKLWAQVTLSSRTFARICWIHVPTHHKAVPAGGKPDADDVLRALIEKKSMINLTAAFNTALKHYLRGEAGTSTV